MTIPADNSKLMLEVYTYANYFWFLGMQIIIVVMGVSATLALVMWIAACATMFFWRIKKTNEIDRKIYDASNY